MSENEIIRALTETLSQPNIGKIIEQIREQYSRTLWLAGNGGSCYNVSHMASDLEALGYDTKCLDLNIARITAITNDYGWGKVYEYQMWHFKAQDILIVLSVHGGAVRKGEVWSNNLVKACQVAK